MRPNRLRTVNDFFREFGGTSEVARLLGVPQSTAAEMKRKRSIHIKHWPKILESERGQDLAISCYILLQMNLKPKDR